MKKYKVGVIGGCGHVGLPFAVINSLAGHTVVAYDINKDLVRICNEGTFPYVEEGSELLNKALHDGNLIFTHNKNDLLDCDIIVIMIGTPIDEEHNPRISYILDFVDNELKSLLEYRDDRIIILRSTIAPGTTDLIRKRLPNYVTLAFCPERVSQGQSMKETKEFPQIIGAYSKEDFNKIDDYFSTFVKETIFLNPTEAEFSKLICNMYRYVNAAFANEMWMVSSQYNNVNIDKVIDATNHNYPRMNMMKPGLTAGPCLGKDGRFLVSKIPFIDLIKSSYEINEGFPEFIFHEMMKVNPNIKSVRLFGMTFKANIDDTRLSLSYKFKKICERNGLIVDFYDPYLKDIDVLNTEPDAFVILTPHDGFKGAFEFTLPGKTYVDIWKIGGQLTKESSLGIVYLKEEVKNENQPKKVIFNTKEIQNIRLPITFEELCLKLNIQTDITMIYHMKNEKNNIISSKAPTIGHIIEPPLTNVDYYILDITAVYTGNA